MTRIEITAREMVIKHQFQEQPLSFEQAKTCALISVDYMQKECTLHKVSPVPRFDYLHDLKEEIKKL